jgi:hypothetical protein
LQIGIDMYDYTDMDASDAWFAMLGEAVEATRAAFTSATVALARPRLGADRWTVCTTSFTEAHR